MTKKSNKSKKVISIVDMSIIQLLEIYPRINQGKVKRNFINNKR